MAELRLESGILGYSCLVFRFPIAATPVYGGFVYLPPLFWRWALMYAPPLNVSRGTHGALWNGKMAELRLETGNLGATGAASCFPIVVAPIYGGFFYLAFPRWLFVGNVRPPRNSRAPPERHGDTEWPNYDEHPEF